MPVVLAGRTGSKRVVAAADAAAQKAGLRVGMAVSKAQALVPGLIVENSAPAADLEGLERLAVWALQRYSPIVAVDPADGLVIESAGAAHLRGGEAAMLTEMLERLAASGVAARAALADSWGAAHALARFAANPALVVPPGESAAAIRPLPIKALRLPDDVVQALRKLGFERIADLADTPRAPLALRFGPELGRRLGTAFGTTPEPIHPIQPPEIVAVRRAFAEPIGAPETLARYTEKLVTELCAALEQKGLGGRRLDLLFHRVDNRIEAIRIGTALPVRDAKRLTRLLCEKLSGVDPGFGIEIMTLAAVLADSFGARQTLSSLVEEPQADVTGLIDTLANRVGERRLYRFADRASDVPERSSTRVGPSRTSAGLAWPGHWPRPSRLLSCPEPIDTMALMPDHPPASFIWRGTRRRVRQADGPERVFGEWWTRDAELAAVRDYFRVEDDAGERFWVFRAGDGEHAATGSHDWFLHGIFG